MIDWVVFDAMGVVFPVPDDVNDLLLPFLRERKPDICAGTVNEAYIRASLGQIDPRGFWSGIGFGEDYPRIESAYLDSRLSLDPGFIPLARRLTRRVRLGLLSNDVGAWSRRLREKFGLEEVFSAVAISGDVGFRKPDPRIYEAFLAKAGAAAGRCAFIDDRLRNLAVAKGIGMRTILFDKGLPDSSDFSADAVARGYIELEAVIEGFTNA
jgi:HAD superfamily hydrolase (TIGR01509 family)